MSIRNDPQSVWRDIAHQAAGHIDSLLLYGGAGAYPNDSHVTEAMGFLLELNKALGEIRPPRMSGQINPSNSVRPFPDISSVQVVNRTKEELYSKFRELGVAYIGGAETMTDEELQTAADKLHDWADDCVAKGKPLYPDEEMWRLEVVKSSGFWPNGRPYPRTKRTQP